jgi:mono/diheme cytochrome c family protein
MVNSAQTLRLMAALLLATASALAAAGDGVPADGQAARSIERGRYLARIAACNDCHTPGYAQSGGQVAEEAWLTGDRLGWRGPWGTTYPANLRLALSRLSEDEWLHNARTVQYRPPMPWFILRDMSDEDLRALYRFVRALGPAGEPAPAYLPPGQQPQGVAVVFPMAPD